MLWFDGSVRDAVDKVKSSNVILLVLVKGEDDLSKKYELYLNKETKFKPEDYVALKISHDSFILQQFREIYVTVPIPSIFLIENNGKPISVVCSNKISDIHSAIKNAIIKQNNDSQKKDNHVEEEVKKIREGVSTENKKQLEEVTSRTSRHVKNVGHKLIDISEEEIKKRLNEIRAFPKFLLIENPSSVRHSSFPHQVPRIQSARIQFRLPNNDMPSWEFPDLSTLGDVRAYLVEKMNLSPNFKLLRMYPRTSFSPQDECKTLAELSLAPNATLIVVPVQDKTVQAKIRNLIVRQSFVSIVLKTLLQPILIVVKFFRKHVLRIQNENENRPERVVSDTAFEKIFNKKTSTSNIHGFKFEDDTDTDGEHPDNGNSTQQRYHK